MTKHLGVWLLLLFVVGVCGILSWEVASTLTSSSSTEEPPGRDNMPTSDPTLGDEEEIVLGVFPFLSSRGVDDLYGPLVIAMTEHLQRPVRLRTASSFAIFSENLAQSAYDIALVQPLEYIGRIDDGYQPIVRVESMLTATVVALPGVEVIGGFAGLAALRIGTPAESSAMRQLVNAELKAAGLDSPDLEILSYTTHTECLDQLVLGTIDVCVTGPVPLREFQTTTGRELVVVAQSAPIASIAFVAAPDLDQETVASVQEYLLGLDDDPENLGLLSSLGTLRYVEILDGDYEAVRALMAAAE